MLKLHIEAENDAFADRPASEIARILRGLAGIIERQGPPDYLVLRDANGNACGEVQFSAPEAFRNHD